MLAEAGFRPCVLHVKYAISGRTFHSGKTFPGSAHAAFFHKDSVYLFSLFFWNTKS